MDDFISTLLTAVALSMSPDGPTVPANLEGHGPVAVFTVHEDASNLDCQFYVYGSAHGLEVMPSQPACKVSIAPPLTVDDK